MSITKLINRLRTMRHHLACTVLESSRERKSPRLNFEPRIGFAWDPFHNGKTAVRGGFGIFDALPLAYELILNSVSTAPFRNARAVLGPNGNISPNAQGGGPDQFPFNIVALSAALPGAATNTRTWNYVQPNLKRNYVYQYNLNIQRQITPNTTVLVGYV